MAMDKRHCMLSAHLDQIFHSGMFVCSLIHIYWFDWMKKTGGKKWAIV